MSNTISQTTNPSPTGRCGNLYDTPVRDAVCAMPYNESHIDYMSSCCRDADIVSYYDDCGLYCLAQGQSVEALSQCLYDEGAKWEDVFCRGDVEATATGDGQPLASSSARVVEDEEREEAGREGEDGDEDDGSDEAEPTDEASFAPVHGYGAKSSFAGVLIGTLLFVATSFGAQLV